MTKRHQNLKREPAQAVELNLEEILAAIQEALLSRPQTRRGGFLISDEALRGGAIKARALKALPAR